LGCGATRRRRKWGGYNSRFKDYGMMPQSPLRR
jgi:hypothetical protein